MAFDHYFQEEHRLFRESVKTFVSQKIKPQVDEWEEQGGFPRDLYRIAGEAGFLGVGFPEQWGGSGGDTFMQVVFTEELMASGSGGLAASLGSHGIALPPILSFGHEALIETVAPPVLKGEKILALAITEPNGGSDVANLTTRAHLEEDHYVVNGAKTFITSGVNADYYTLAVRTGEPGYNGISLLLVDRQLPGISVSQPLKKMGWWASDTAELSFTDVKVPRSHLIGEENQGFLYIVSNFVKERLLLAVMATETAQLAFDAARAYARERSAFGKAIAKKQVIKHKLVEMATSIEVARAYNYHVAQLIDEGKNPIKAVAMAKNNATKVSDKVTYDAVQIFGGMGFMRECLVERLYRDNRILSIGGGTYEIMNEVIASQLNL